MQKQILNTLYQLADPDRAKKAITNYPSSQEILGVSMPNVRLIVKELGAQLKGQALTEILPLVNLLIDSKILEAQLTAFNLLASRKEWWGKLDEEALISLARNLDNWVSVDTWSCYLAGPAWRLGHLRTETIRSWTQSRDRWWRRAALACTTALNRKTLKGPGHAEPTLEICQALVQDRDDMVVKALSWALRSLGALQPEPVFDFLEEYDNEIAPRVKREVLHKLETGVKHPRKTQ